jgi:hypothetical protein
MTARILVTEADQVPHPLLAHVADNALDLDP